MRRQLVQHDRRAPPRSRRSAAAVRPPISSTPGSLLVDGDVRAEHELAQPRRLRRAHADDAARGAADELVDARVGDQPAAADHDQVVGGQRHLAHQVRRDEDRAALGGERLEQVADPVDALRVEAVDRLVEQQRLRVAEQRGRDAEPLAHAERELAGALARDLVQADQVDQLARRAASGCRASARARAGGCRPSGRCAPSAPRAARRPRAAAPRGRGSACR